MAFKNKYTVISLFFVLTIGIVISFNIHAFINWIDWGDTNLIELIRTSPQSIRVKTILEYDDFVCRHLRKGMDKKNVRKYVGDPQNTNNKKVWMWINSYDQYIKTKDKMTWQAMYSYDKAGYHLIFDKEGKLLHNGFNITVAGSPEEYCAGFMGTSLDVARKYLEEK
jgi:hypothetical protein